MALASTYKVVLGSIGFLVFWVLAVFSNVPILPIGRTAGSLLGAMLMVVFQVLTPEKAYAAIDLSILCLLFGTMVVSYYLQRADMFKYLGKLLAWKSIGPRDLLCRVCIITAISSALFTNDTSCVILTEFVLKLAKQHNLPPHPFLLALATSANIGSAATPIGNPQNLVIAINSGISFWDFLMGVLPAMLIGVFVNILLLLLWYWKVLSVEKYEQDDMAEVAVDDSATEFVLESTNVESTSNVTIRNRGISHGSKELSGDGSSQENEETIPSDRGSQVETVPSEEKENIAVRVKTLIWKSCVYLVTVGMLIGLLWGLDMSWTALTAALTLVVLDFKDARPSLDKVSYSLLVFFCGMFITVAGFNNTGLPSALWDLLEPYSKVNKASGVAVLSIVILVLSNVASNVPTVLLLGSNIAASAAELSTDYEKKAWLILAWVSTVAGNFSLLGSAANLIVCEEARRSPEFRYTLTFWNHLKFGLPSTLIVTAIGLTVI